ncbi:lysophospholipase [Paenibacillus albidus]|uniref:GDSL-type esterase/lipase family protein n=1 Tax=Paenibacillus albidus TaxID=2041023 RepID=UPI001BEA0DBD|nr:GDSL-type esterase/lipase family protein [Paenibacillus albidus]MBT2293525.1 lysophospholipase [Paenibacillus albidus]
MNESNWTWRSVSVISIAATLILMAGFIYAVNDIINPVPDVPLTSLPKQTPASKDGAEDELRIVALGDSLAKGTGDNTGNGFVKRAVTMLSSEGRTVELMGNMGINGQTTAVLQNRLNEEGVQYALRQANVILLSIGGNDLFRGSELAQNGGGTKGQAKVPAPAGETAGPTSTPGSGAVSTGDEELSAEALLAALPEASARLGSILERIAEINPQAHIYYIGLYNPFGDIPDLLVPGNQAVTSWNNAAMDIINRHGNMTLVPTFDLFNRHLDKYLSSDHFHPNGDGYQRMGERIVQAVR